MFVSRFCRQSFNFSARQWTWIILVMPKYAVAVGHKPGIYDTWSDCSAQVKGCKGAKFKKFNTQEEAQAFIDEHRMGNKRTLDELYDTFDGPEEVMDYEAPAPYMHFMAENPSELMHSLNSRLIAMESKLNSFIDKTTKVLENLTSRVVKMEGSGGPSVQEPAKKAKLDTDFSDGNINFSKDHKGFVTVYTDGACSSNGRTGAKAGVGVWFGEKHPLNVSAPVKGPPTNNTAEIQAARIAITQAASAGVRKLQIHTDSKFVIDSITKWIHRWKKNGWKLQSGGAVKNKTEFLKLDDAIQTVDAVEWVHVRGHSGHHGNEMADLLAREGANKYDPNIRYADHVDAPGKERTDSPDLDHLEESSNSSE